VADLYRGLLPRGHHAQVAPPLASGMDMCIGVDADADVSPFLCILSFSLAVLLSQARRQQGAMAVERCSMAALFPCFLSLAVGTYTAACRCPGHLGRPLSSTSFHPRAFAGRRSSRSLASSKPRCGQAVRVIVAELHPLSSVVGSPKSGRTPPALPLAADELHHPEPGRPKP